MANIADAQYLFTNNTAAALASANKTYPRGLLIWENDTGYYKIGNGSTAYNSLPYGAGALRVDGVLTVSHSAFINTTFKRPGTIGVSINLENDSLLGSIEGNSTLGGISLRPNTGTRVLNITSSGRVLAGDSTDNGLGQSFQGQGGGSFLGLSGNVADDGWLLGGDAGTCILRPVISGVSKPLSDFKYVNSTNTYQMETALQVDSALTAVDVYNTTTASAANVNVDSVGRLRRSTSSKKYKEDIQSIDDSVIESILSLEPIKYRPKAGCGDTNRTYYGFIAEDVSKIDPRFVDWEDYEAYEEEETYTEKEKDEKGEEIDVEKTRLVTKYKKKETPTETGVFYDRLVVPIIGLLKKQDAIIKDLTKRIEALEAK